MGWLNKQNIYTHKFRFIDCAKETGTDMINVVTEAEEKSLGKMTSNTFYVFKGKEKEFQELLDTAVLKKKGQEESPIEKAEETVEVTEEVEGVGEEVKEVKEEAEEVTTAPEEDPELRMLQSKISEMSDKMQELVDYLKIGKGRLKELLYEYRSAPTPEKKKFSEETITGVQWNISEMEDEFKALKKSLKSWIKIYILRKQGLSKEEIEKELAKK